MAIVDSLRQKMAEQNVDCFLIASPVNRRYVTGFTGSAGVVWISATHQTLIVDFRYTEQAQEQAPDWDVITHDGLPEQLKQLIADRGVKAVAVEGEHITVAQWQEWNETFAMELQPVKGWVEELRIVKEPWELDNLRRAAEIADHAFAQLLPQVQSGVKEKDLALELEFTMRKAGADGVSFSPIVASGPRGALPHARPGNRMLQHGDFVVMDFGCLYKGYCSDMTRTVVVGEPTEKHLLIYDLVLKAQETALAGVRPGVTGIEVDKIARDIIEDGGYGRYFGHGLGHGVGLEVHEEPRLSKLGKTALRPGMIVTVEPGVYLPGWGGVRIEDLVLVTEDGSQCLSSTFKELYMTE